jgi:hypothetical protein
MDRSTDRPTLGTLWDLYWSKHAELMTWHAATYRRRVKCRVIVADGADAVMDDAPADMFVALDAEFVAVEYPCAEGQLVVTAELQRPSASPVTNAHGRSPPPLQPSKADVELLFAAIARRTLIAAVSFDDETSGKKAAHLIMEDEEAGRATFTFRAQVCNAEVARAVADELGAVVGFHVEPSPRPVRQTSLVLRGASIADVLRHVSFEALHALFLVFGPCTVLVPKDTELREWQQYLSEGRSVVGDIGATPRILVTYNDDETALATTDAAAALRTLQLWLAFDWALLLTYDVAPVLPTYMRRTRSGSEPGVVGVKRQRDANSAFAQQLPSSSAAAAPRLAHGAVRADAIDVDDDTRSARQSPPDGFEPRTFALSPPPSPAPSADTALPLVRRATRAAPIA